MQIFLDKFSPCFWYTLQNTTMPRLDIGCCNAFALALDTAKQWLQGVLLLKSMWYPVLSAAFSACHEDNIRRVVNMMQYETLKIIQVQQQN